MHGTEEQQKAYPLMNNYGYPNVELVHGSGMRLYDVNHREFLDFTAGIAVCNLGHAHPAVTNAIVRQAERLVHTSNLFRNPLREELAQRLVSLSGLEKVFFCNSGTEANEAALKLARRFAWNNGDSERTKILSLPGAFHGRTYGSLSATRKPAYHEGFGPMVPDCVTPASLEQVLDAVDTRTAACLVEVVQGEGGVRPLETPWLQNLEARLREVGALLIIDEIQTGVGRTGTFFAYEQAGLHPDIVTMAKGLANGIPVGAVLAKAEVAEAFTPGSHGTTFGGNLLAMAAALAVVEIISQPDFLGHVRDTGLYLQKRLSEVAEDVLGRGLMVGITVPDAATFVKHAEEQNILLTTAGPTRVRFVPPLTVTRQDVDELMDRLF